MSLLAEASLLWNFRKHQKWQLHMSIIALDLELDVELDLQGVHYICSHPFHQEKKKSDILQMEGHANCFTLSNLRAMILQSSTRYI